jgi:hypothetical protein
MRRHLRNYYGDPVREEIADSPREWETPLRFPLMHAWGMVSAVIVSFCSGVAALGDSVFLATGILENKTLILVCIIGACGGSLVSILFYPPKSKSQRLIAAKFLASGLTSIMFTPYIVHWMTPEPGSEVVLAVSGVVGLSAFAVATWIRRKTIGWLEDGNRNGFNRDDRE